MSSIVLEDYKSISRVEVGVGVERLKTSASSSF